MSQLMGEMEHPGTGLRAHIYSGWSWPAFFFGPIWYLVKGMWGLGLLYLVLCFTGIGWLVGLIVAPMVANRHLTEHLGGKGYVRVGR